jgi:hypothetical protein
MVTRRETLSLCPCAYVKFRAGIRRLLGGTLHESPHETRLMTWAFWAHASQVQVACHLVVRTRIGAGL